MAETRHKNKPLFNVEQTGSKEKQFFKLTPEYKVCSACCEVKGIAEFTKREANTDGRCGYCKTCASRKSRERYKRNPEKYRATKYKWKEENKTRYIETRLRHRHGINLEELSKLSKSQEGRCAVCSETKGLEIDHDHKHCPTRNHCKHCIRGLLCDRHNKALGFFSLEELEKAVQYLRKNSFSN